MPNMLNIKENVIIAIDHFTVVFLVSWLLSRSEAKVDLFVVRPWSFSDVNLPS